MRRPSLESLAALASLAALLAAGCGSPAGGSPDGGTTDGGAKNACTDLSPKPGLAITTHGAVQGHTDGHTFAYLGIPYAAPPVGDLRWKAPQDPGCLSGTLDGSQFSAQCPQTDDNGTVVGSEDCLYLNVWQPTGGATGLPVLVFVHGGSNIAGSTKFSLFNVKVYEGANLADEAHAVVVTLNYRLGPLGFLALPSLATTDPAGSEGNFGLLDQLAALRWVKANARAFGGDPSKVLLFGESAGAIDTCALYASPLAKGLFSAALMESGLCDGEVFAPLAGREAISSAAAANAGCTDPSTLDTCLRALPATDVITKMPPAGPGLIAVNWDPTIDGVVLDDYPLNIIAAGKQNHVPFTIGSNSRETELFINNVNTQADYTNQAHALFGQALGDRVLAEYPASDYANPREALVHATTDLVFTCPTRRAARAAAGSQTEPVHRYFFTQTTAGIPPMHGVELFYVFDHLDDANLAPTQGEYAMVDAMQQAWRGLAEKGDPSGAKVPAWPAYDPATDDALDLADPMSTTQGIRSAHCDFWDQVAAGN